MFWKKEWRPRNNLSGGHLSSPSLSLSSLSALPIDAIPNQSNGPRSTGCDPHKPAQLRAWVRAETQPRRPLQTWGCLPPRAEAPFANPHTDPHSCPSLPPALSSHSSPWITQNTMKQDYRASLEAQMVKNLPALQETRVRSLGRQKSPGEKGHGSPLQSSCLENLHGQRSLAGYSPWGHKESDTTESLSATQHRVTALRHTGKDAFIKNNSTVKERNVCMWNGMSSFRPGSH